MCNILDIGEERGPKKGTVISCSVGVVIVGRKSSIFIVLNAVDMYSHSLFNLVQQNQGPLYINTKTQRTNKHRMPGSSCGLELTQRS